MPVIEVQRDSATRTPVQPHANKTMDQHIESLVAEHGAGNVFIDGVSVAATKSAANMVEAPAVEPPKKAAKKKGGAK